MKKIILFLILGIFVVFFTFSAVLWGDNKGIIFNKANECLEQRNNIETRWSITNPFNPKKYLICNGSNSEITLYQVMLDLLLSETDSDVENYLKSTNTKEYSVELNKEISDNFRISDNQNSFFNRYKDICEKKVVEYSMDFVQENWSGTLTTTNWIQDFLKDNNYSWRCFALINNKLKAYEDIGYAVLKRNKVDSFSTNKKTFMDKIKDNYEKLLAKIDIYIWQFSRVNDKWNPNKDTKYANNQ